MHKSQCAQEIIIGLTVFLVTFMSVYLSRYQRLTSEISVQAERAILYLPESGQISDLITDLYEQGIHFDKNELLWAANLLNWKSYRAGRYEINGSYSYNRFLSKLGRGSRIHFWYVFKPVRTMTLSLSGRHCSSGSLRKNLTQL